MDYEKEYKAALERCREFYAKLGNKQLKEEVEDIFPELKESEDEKTIKEIKQFIRSRGMSLAQSKVDSWIAWLEKQNDQKDILEDAILDSNEDGLIAETIRYKNEKQGEQKPADKVEPKFKVGDWVIDKQGIVHQIANVIENVTNHTYAYDIVGCGYFNDNTEGVRLWTIQDAKDGDVLVHNSILFIFMGIENGIVKGICTELSDTILNFGEPEYDNDYCPATKEQSNLLFSKMHEAGYEWDAEKKELKKIEQRMVSAEAKEAMYSKPVEWSEKDEYNYNTILHHLDLRKEKYKKECNQEEQDRYQGLYDWLKSIRPQNMWKPSEEQMKALEWQVNNTSEGSWQYEESKNLLEQLKKLKG